jgi:hypothetical protein
LWTTDASDTEYKNQKYSYVLLPTGVSVPAETDKLGTDNKYVYVVGKDQGMLVLPQTTVNTNNDAEIKGAEVSTDFYVEVTYRLSNIQKTVRAAFTDINKLAQGLTFEMGRQYALTLEFSDTAVEFDISVEGWEDDTPAYAATTVVFDENKPEGVTGALTEPVYASNSGFIYGQDLPSLTPDIAPSLAGWFFLGYYDAPEGGTQYYKADLNSVDGVTWDKAGPSCILYAHWTDHLWSRSNIYFAPDEPDGVVGSLTFFEDDSSKFGYQGLYFKWGSLIGVAAGSNYDTFTGETYLYIPALGTGKYYKVRASEVSEDYNTGTTQDMTDAVLALRDFIGSDLGANWSLIPHVKDGSDPDQIANTGNGRTDDQLTVKSTATGLYQYYKGDICKFLSDKNGSNGSGLTRTWVMPKSEVWKGEYYALPYINLSDWSYDWQLGSLINTTPDGTDGSDVYLTYITTTDEKVIFPAAGYRNGGSLLDVGLGGYYWGSSVYYASYAYSLFFYSGSVCPSNHDIARSSGFPVRCVQEL